MLRKHHLRRKEGTGTRMFYLFFNQRLNFIGQPPFCLYIICPKSITDWKYFSSHLDTTITFNEIITC